VPIEVQLHLVKMVSIQRRIPSTSKVTIGRCIRLKKETAMPSLSQ
jgi:hypothetical protein